METNGDLVICARHERHSSRTLGLLTSYVESSSARFPCPGTRARIPKSRRLLSRDRAKSAPYERRQLRAAYIRQKGHVAMDDESAVVAPMASKQSRVPVDSGAVSDDERVVIRMLAKRAARKWMAETGQVAEATKK